MSVLADMPDVLTIEETAKVLRIGRSAAYAAAGVDFPVIKIGRSLRVPRHRLEQLLGLNDDEPASNGLVVTSAEAATDERPD